MGRYAERSLSLLGQARKYLLSSASLFISVTLGVKVLTALSNFVILAWLHPELMGIWQILIVVRSYATILGLGVVNAMNRELPYLLGCGDINGAEKVAGSSYFYTVGVSFLGIFLFWIYGLIYPPEDENWRNASYAAAFVWFSSNYRTYLEGTFRTGAQFNALSRCNLIEALFALVALPMVAWYGFEGFLLRSILVSLLGIGILHYVRPMRVKPNLNFANLQKLIIVGMPLFFNAYLLALANGIDRLFLADFGVQEVGLFTPVEAIFTMMATFPQALASYFYPKMTFDYGRTFDKNKIKKSAFVLTIAMVAICLSLAVITFVLSEFCLERYLPQYAPVKSSVVVALIAGVLTAGHSMKIVFYVFKSWGRLAVYTLSYVGCKVVFGLICLKYFSDPVFGVTISCLLTAFVIGGVTLMLTLTIKDDRLQETPSSS